MPLPFKPQGSVLASPSTQTSESSHGPASTQPSRVQTRAWVPRSLNPHVTVASAPGSHALSEESGRSAAMVDLSLHPGDDAPSRAAAKRQRAFLVAWGTTMKIVAAPRAGSADKARPSVHAGRASRERSGRASPDTFNGISQPLADRGPRSPSRVAALAAQDTSTLPKASIMRSLEKANKVSDSLRNTRGREVLVHDHDRIFQVAYVGRLAVVQL